MFARRKRLGKTCYRQEDKQIQSRRPHLIKPPHFEEKITDGLAVANLINAQRSFCRWYIMPRLKLVEASN